MRLADRVPNAVGTLATTIASATLATAAWAQAPVTQPSSPVATPTQSAEGSNGLIAVLLVIGLLVVIGVVGKMVDFRTKREDEAVRLQAQISDALMRDQMLSRFPITPTAHAPIWRRSTVTIEVSGQVPTSELRRAVLRLVEQEASRIRSDFRIHDRIAVVPSTTAHAA